MEITAYHAKYYAHELTKRCPADSIEKLAGALVDAQVDLNPHQVEAALFAFQSPLSKGALLADEVGLGKTIEAGLVISQRWAERKRRMLIITPANLRKQWQEELQTKFFLPSTILESRSFNQAIKAGVDNPFESDELIICSYQFAKSKELEVASVPWDLVVIDEAHRLRNVYKPSNVIANTLRDALRSRNKILLTATPLQNSLLELFGLVSFIDEHTFGDVKSFREQYAQVSDNATFDTLKRRLSSICHRTLRRQVVAYVPYTRRHAIVQEFTPSESEDRLYELVSDYLQRPNLFALPASQRSLMTLVLRKLLASSSFAIAGALETMSARLRQVIADQPAAESLSDQLDDDYESLDETADEWGEEKSGQEPLSSKDLEAIEQEIRDLESFRELAESIEINAKGEALLVALERAFSEAERLGAQRKAIIFTESRRTQDYLCRVLADSPYSEGIVLFNGSNNDQKSRDIYQQWKAKYADTDRVTGSRTADMRSAIVDYFRETGQVMVATEAGAEGINLQFCSLVVNYDLPWNPQRIEQRIGRCHRYGQKHDVVVVNFLNRNNEADVRVFELLSEKFSLFEGVFGASDDVLGAIENGVDFEKRIAAIYQRCREPDDIRRSFEQLQSELSSQIDAAMTRTRQQLLDHFDTEVHDKLKINLEQGKAYLNRYERLLMQVTQHELNGEAQFIEGQHGFRLKSNPFPEIGTIPTGLYELPRRSGDAHFYRLGHPLAKALLKRAKQRDLPMAEITFTSSAEGPNVAALDPYLGHSGELMVSRLTMQSMVQDEDFILVAAIDDNRAGIDPEVASLFFKLPVDEVTELAGQEPDPQLFAETESQSIIVQQRISKRNADLFEAESDKLDLWADDLKMTLEREIKDMDRQIKEAKRAASLALTLQDKLAGQKQVKTLESQRNQKRRALFDAQDEVDERRGDLIKEVEQKLSQDALTEQLFAFRWRYIQR